MTTGGGAMEFKPDLFTFNDGSHVMCKNCWKRRRPELLETLSREAFGITPEKPEKVTFTEISEDDKCASGHAVLKRLNIEFETEKGPFSFPMNLFVPAAPKKAPSEYPATSKNFTLKKSPLILLINFRPDAYDMYYPAEEIIDHGFALGVIDYQSVTTDDADMTNGLAAMYSRRNDGTDWGKIGMWAFAMSRALDALETLPYLDTEKVTFIGHSRLGKTALWAGAQDERARFVVSNSSGCMGAAYERAKTEGAETVKNITTEFPFWFCENLKKYAGKTDEMPFDMHYLLALLAPRYLLVGSAEEDLWADPVNEKVCALGVQPVWDLYDQKDSIHYHLRTGVHFLGRPDWVEYLKFIEQHL